MIQCTWPDSGRQHTSTFHLTAPNPQAAVHALRQRAGAVRSRPWDQGPRAPAGLAFVCSLWNSLGLLNSLRPHQSERAQAALALGEVGLAAGQFACAIRVPTQEPNSWPE